MKIRNLIRNLIWYLFVITVFFLSVSVFSFYTTTLSTIYIQIYQDTTQFPMQVEAKTALFLNDAQIYAETGDKAYLESATKTLTEDLVKLEHTFDTYKYRSKLDAQFITDVDNMMLELHEFLLADLEIINGLNGVPSEEAFDSLTSDEHRATAKKIQATVREISNTAAETNSERSYRMQQINTISLLVLILGMLSVIITVITVLLKIRNRVAKLSDVVENVEHLAQGNFESIMPINFKVKDEAYEINYAVEGAINNIKNLSENLFTLAQEHRNGNSFYQIDTTEFTGEYANLTKQVNDFGKEYVDVILDLMSCIDGISNGDFNSKLKLDVYVGQKAAITDIVVKTITNLRNIESEINFCINRVKEGYITDVKVRDDQFEGEWQSIIKGIGLIIDSFRTPLVSANDIFRRLSEGDLSARLEGEYVGQFKNFQDYVEKGNSTIQSYIQEVDTVLNQLANNNYNVTIEREYIGDFTVMKASLLAIINQLNTVLGDISEATNIITSSAAASASASVTLAEASIRQNESISLIQQETESVIQKTKENADSANTARNLSQKTLDNAKNGNKVMTEMVVTIEEISVAAKSIENIIRIIEDIAFQTNLLALNAAVEAANAGVHGKGFAVVADEVRTLAMRSQSAANDTKELINKSLTKVNEGTQKADSTSKALGEILHDITEVSKIIENIATLSKEQLSQIDNFGHSINTISEVVSQNTGTSEESAAISQEIQAQTETLKGIVSGFELREILN